MGKGFKHGAGVVASDDSILNFTVRAYQSDVELNTATPDENTIGVVTTNPITEWYFSSTKPETVAEGAVWFKVGDTSRSAFNALKQKTIMVYPLRAEQYVSGAWSVKTAKIYQNEAWTDWMIWLYKNGDEYTDATGGWAVGESNNSSATTVTKEGAYIQLKVSDDTASRSHIVTSKKVDFTQYKTINARVTITESGSMALALRLGYGSAKTGNLASLTTRTEMRPGSIGEYTVSYDISEVSGEYFPIFGVGYFGTARVTEIWFE